jgi:hypothetical protein
MWLILKIVSLTKTNIVQKEKNMKNYDWFLLITHLFLFSFTTLPTFFIPYEIQSMISPARWRPTDDVTNTFVCNVSLCCYSNINPLLVINIVSIKIIHQTLPKQCTKYVNNFYSFYTI